MNNLASVFLLAFCAAKLSATPVEKGIKGKCPEVNFVDNFDSPKSMGEWFVIKATGQIFPCLTYNLKETRPNHFHSFVTPPKLTIEMDAINFDDIADGLKVNFKVNPYLDGGKMKVFASDYVNFAGIFTCKEADDIHFQSIDFLSRTRELSEEARKALDLMLTNYPEVDVTLMNDVMQDGC